MRIILFIISEIYGTIIFFRNLLFDYGILKSTSYKTPIICVGNLSIGGTGKTPHIMLIAKLLSNRYKVGILSRGYGRKSSGFSYVELDSSASKIGDEPLQIKLNNPQCIVAVEKNRRKGIQKILIDHPDTNLILLDDGFQHRKIRAGLNILLTPFYNPFTNDALLPIGTLREHANEARRADIIIISKSPNNLKPTENKKIIESLNLGENQQAYFSSIIYYKYKCIKDDTVLKNEEDYNITLVSGIENATPLIKYLEKKKRQVNLVRFADHHNYTAKDVKKILSIHNKDKSTKKLILTTEKDATKLKAFMSDFKEEKIYYIPIEVTINGKEKFEKQILEYVRNS